MGLFDAPKPRMIKITNPGYADYLRSVGRFDLLGEEPMPKVNRIIVNPPNVLGVQFVQLPNGSLYRHCNRENDTNVYIKTCDVGVPKSIALWSGDICTPSADSMVEIVRSVTIERV